MIGKAGKMTNIQAIDLLKGLEQSLDDYCELNDEGKTAFHMAITALEVFGNSEQLPSVQPEPKWIPCSERMPERADNVIICYKAGDYTLVSTGRYLYKFKMWYVDVVGDLRDGVTAWRPLPEPYRGGEK